MECTGPSSHELSLEARTPHSGRAPTSRRRRASPARGLRRLCCHQFHSLRLRNIVLLPSSTCEFPLRFACSGQHVPRTSAAASKTPWQAIMTLNLFEANNSSVCKHTQMHTNTHTRCPHSRKPKPKLNRTRCPHSRKPKPTLNRTP